LTRCCSIGNTTPSVWKRMAISKRLSLSCKTLSRIIPRNANKLTFCLCELCENLCALCVRKTVFLNTKFLSRHGRNQKKKTKNRS
jgi:hypothetical protein